MKRPLQLLDVFALLEAGLVAGQVGNIVGQPSDAVVDVECSDEEGCTYTKVPFAPLYTSPHQFCGFSNN
jgi:hypothetical protein